MGSNSNNILVDANIWISYFDQNDAHYQRAGKLLNEYTSIQPNLLLITDYILQEVITIFLHRNKPDFIQDLIKMIDQESYIEILSVDSYFLSSVLSFIQQQKYKPKISLTDWSLLFLTDELNCTLLTFDKQLNNTYQRLSQ